MNNKLKILAIDDEPENLSILEEVLSDDYDFDSYTSGTEGLKLLFESHTNKKPLPFLVLLDVNMPTMNGLEVCKKIKRLNATKHIQVMFISALCAEEEQIAGYDAGGDDYICKPFSLDTLVNKIKLSEKAFIENSQIKRQLTDATKIAMKASLKESESDTILSSVHELYSLDNNKDVIHNILSACDVYGLNVIITIDLGTKNEELLSTKGSIKQIELDLIKQLRDAGEIYHFGKRTIFSKGDISLLVLNMPLEDDGEYNHLIDHLTILVQGANSRITAITSEIKRENQRQELMSLIVIVQELISSLEKQQILHQVDHGNIMTELMEDVESSFYFLGLTEEQEDSFRGLISKTEKRVGDIFDKGADLQSKLTAIKMMLELKGH